MISSLEKIMSVALRNASINAWLALTSSISAGAMFVPSSIHSPKRYVKKLNHEKALSILHCLTKCNTKKYYGK
jgi:hypothetical protein